MPDPARPKAAGSADSPAAGQEAQVRTGHEGGHMSSTAGQVNYVAGAGLPYVVTLSHHEGEATQRAFATMREAEAFIKRNTPVPGRTLSKLYDRPAGDE
jgi:hypothetical protein